MQNSSINNIKVFYNELSKHLKKGKKEGDKLEVTIANKITIGESETELFTNLLVIIKDLLEDDSN